MSVILFTVQVVETSNWEIAARLRMRHGLRTGRFYISATLT